MMKLVYAKNPQWANRNQTKINLIVRFEEIDEELPFAADSQDVEIHSRDIYTSAVSGAFGEIKEFNPTVPTESEVSQAVKYERDKRLSATDWTQSADVPQSTKDKWIPYRQSLRDFPQQEGFPWYNQVLIETDYGFDIEASNAPWPISPK
jgi:hypothetical protein